MVCVCAWVHESCESSPALVSPQFDFKSSQMSLSTVIHYRGNLARTWQLLTSCHRYFPWPSACASAMLFYYTPAHTRTQTQTHSHTHLLTTPTKKQVFYSVDPIKGSFPEGAGTIKIKRESAKRTEQQQSDCSLLTSVCWKSMTMWGFYRFNRGLSLTMTPVSLSSCWHQLSPKDRLWFWKCLDARSLAALCIKKKKT